MFFNNKFRLIQSMDFDVVIFDTAPTGHTLRLLQFPTLIEKSLGKLISFKSQIMPMLSQVNFYIIKFLKFLKLLNYSLVQFSALKISL